MPLGREALEQAVRKRQRFLHGISLFCKTKPKRAFTSKAVFGIRQNEAALFLWSFPKLSLYYFICKMGL